MSAVYFTTQHEGEARLSGRERAWMGGLVTDIASAAMPFFARDIEPRLNPAKQPRFGQMDRQQVALVMRHDDDQPPLLVDHDGTPLGSFSLQLNTALILGSDPIALMARLHGQCEIHCYIEGVNRAWLADLIDAGRATGVMRDGQGWEEVRTLLRGRNNQPVVCHYSVTDSFPNPTIAGWDPPPSADDPDEPDWDAWYDLPDDEQWTRALAGLRGRGGGVGLELRPDHLRYPFGHARSLLDLFHRQPAVTPT